MAKQLFFRRCHRCDSVSYQSGQPVKRCSSCGKPLADFFYFDDREKEVWSEGDLRPHPHHGEYGPIHGLTACWEPF